MTHETRGAHSARTWMRSSYSSNEGGLCVEVAHTPQLMFVRDSKVTDGPCLPVPHAGWAALVRAWSPVWIRSSRSSNEGGQCVEVAVGAVGVLVRDSRNPGGARVRVAAEGWSVFVRRAAQ